MSKSKYYAETDRLLRPVLLIIIILTLVLSLLVSCVDSMSNTAILFALGFATFAPLIAWIIKRKKGKKRGKEPDALETKATATELKSCPMDAYKLANVLKGKAPADVLEHCDSIMHNAVLLETYIMQCENNGRISNWTANFLRKSYKKAIERAKTSGVQNNFSQTSQSVPSYSVSTRDLERVYHNVYNAVPNLQCVDRLCKLFGGESFCSKICDSAPFCRMIFAENQSKDLLDYIYKHNKSAAYLCCIDVLRKQSGQKH